jgi:glucosamine-6-phosphate deaminase
MPIPLRTFPAGALRVQVFSSSREASGAAALAAAEILRDAIARDGRARIAVSTGNSQLQFIEALVTEPGVNWNAVEAFHLDEYAGLPATHAASFRRWLSKNLAERVPLAAMHYLAGDAVDAEAECCRYAALLSERSIDVGFVGIGENGHIAFNDPQVADFVDSAPAKVVRLDDACRRQQVGEGHFDDISAVPERALTLTCPTLLGMSSLICCVPDLRKAEAVRRTIEGPISTTCPASILRTHPCSQLFLDRDSASLLRI